MTTTCLQLALEAAACERHDFQRQITVGASTQSSFVDNRPAWRTAYLIAAVQSQSCPRMCRCQDGHLRAAVCTYCIGRGRRRRWHLRAAGLRAQEAHGLWRRVCGGLQGQQGLWVSGRLPPCPAGSCRLLRRAVCVKRFRASLLPMLHAASSLCHCSIVLHRWTADMAHPIARVVSQQRMEHIC